MASPTVTSRPAARARAAMPASESTPLASIPAALRRSSSSPRPQPTSSTGPRPSSSGDVGLDQLGDALAGAAEDLLEAAVRLAVLIAGGVAAEAEHAPGALVLEDAEALARHVRRGARPDHQLVQLALGVVDARDEPLRRRLLDAEAPAQVLLVAGQRLQRPADLVEPALDAGLLARPGGAVAVELEREPPQRRREREVELPLGGRVRAQRAEQRAPRGALRPAAAAAAEVEPEPVLEVAARERRPGGRGRRARAAAADPDEPLARDRADRLGAQPGGDVGAARAPRAAEAARSP